MNEWEERIMERQEAFQEGEAAGFARGEVSGEAKGRLDVARNMLRKGMEKTVVSEMTGLTAEEIDALL